MCGIPNLLGCCLSQPGPTHPHRPQGYCGYLFAMRVASLACPRARTFGGGPTRHSTTKQSRQADLIAWTCEYESRDQCTVVVALVKLTLWSSSRF